jgi:hypothetical protein
MHDLVADDADGAEKTGMSANRIACATMAGAVILAFALFIAAIITRNLWLSLALGSAGALTFGYAVLCLRGSHKNLPQDNQDEL